MKPHPSFSPSDENEFAKFDGRPGHDPYGGGHVPEGHRGGGFGTEPAHRGLPLQEETPKAGRDAEHYSGHATPRHTPPENLAHEEFGGDHEHPAHTTMGHAARRG
jgi:hypothetical protein